MQKVTNLLKKMSPFIIAVTIFIISVLLMIAMFIFLGQQ